MFIGFELRGWWGCEPHMREMEQTVTVTPSTHQKKITLTQTLPPITRTHTFFCHLSAPFPVQYISSWWGKGIANMPSECFLLFSGSGRVIFFFFFASPCDRLKCFSFCLAYRKWLHKTFRRLAENCWSWFCRYCAGPWRWIIGWLNWGKTSELVQACNLRVGSLSICDLLCSLHHISNTSLQKVVILKAYSLCLSVTESDPPQQHPPVSSVFR